MKQTVVEWLLDEIIAKDWWYLPESMKQDIIEQAKAMEKDQIIEAVEDGQRTDFYVKYYDAEQYYNKTFKSE